jgi:hypothetical protein
MWNPFSYLSCGRQRSGAKMWGGYVFYLNILQEFPKAILEYTVQSQRSIRNIRHEYSLHIYEV